MDYSEILNSEQFEALKYINGPILISAGAGSGKTRVLTYRIAFLIDKCNINARNILAITFTNKAANEMKERICKIAPSGEQVLVSTFHSFCAKMLRTYSSFLKDYNENFSIYSEQDTTKIYKKLFEKYGIDTEDDKQKFKKFVSTIKNDNLNVSEFVSINKFYHKIDNFKSFYLDYNKELKTNNAMDFDDLILNFYNLLKSNSEVLNSVQEHFKYIHVDEFQDTNRLQYELVKIMASKYQNILIVGDEDQSIYSWRGANIDNLFNFTKDFSNCKILKLERNYRSTKNILKRANMLIKNNSNRLDKQLYTENEEGSEISYTSLTTEADEADFVIRKINMLLNSGVPHKEIAILMRLNALSRPFEDRLLAYNIPYRIYGGFKFYERAEIKNVLAYLVAVANPLDNNNIARIINFPKRKIGEASIKKMEEVASQYSVCLKTVILGCENFPELPNSLKQKLMPLKTLLENIDMKAKELNIYDLFDYIIKNANILESFDKHDEQDKERLLNINSLFKSIYDYNLNNPDATLKDYLESVSLTTDMDKDDSDGITIASVHAAKGLEFDAVFVVGMEDKIFPLYRYEGEDDMEEERRLMYVAITRAKKYLFLTSCETRFLYGKRDLTLKSRFLKEIDILPQKINFYNSEYSNAYNNSYGGRHSNPLNDNTKHKFSSPDNISSFSNSTSTSTSVSKNNFSKDKITVGAMVRHPRFGSGVITDISTYNSNHCVEIDFGVFGKKTLSLDFAPITFM